MSTTARHLAVATAVVAVGAWAWWVTGLPPFSTAATVAVVGSGAVVAIGSGRGGPGTGETLVPPRSAAVWGGLALAMAAWQIGALVQHPRVEHPTLSSLANAVLDARPVRTVAFMGWLAGMAWLARR